MATAVTAVVVVGIAAALTLGLAAGLDAAGAAILVAIVALGGLGIAAARRAGSGRIAPGRCDSCGGLISATAPYCKHCGAVSTPPGGAA